MRQRLNNHEYCPPEKGTRRSASATLRRRLHEFYFGGSLFVVLRAANRTAPDLSFRTPPRGATACRENVFLLLANTLASVSQLCRTRIIKRGKIIPRKSLQPNNLQKIDCQGKIPRRAIGRKGIPYEEGTCPVINSWRKPIGLPMG